MSAWATSSGDEWREAARRYEDLGFDTLWVADHVGMLDPFTALVAAASGTDRLGLGTAGRARLPARGPARRPPALAPLIPHHPP